MAKSISLMASLSHTYCSIPLLKIAKLEMDNGSGDCALDLGKEVGGPVAPTASKWSISTRECREENSNEFGSNEVI